MNTAAPKKYRDFRSKLYPKAVWDPPRELNCRVSNVVLVNGKIKAIESCSVSPDKAVLFYKSVEKGPENVAQVDGLVGPVVLLNEAGRMLQTLWDAVQQDFGSNLNLIEKGIPKGVEPSLETIVDTVIADRMYNGDCYPLPRPNKFSGHALIISIVKYPVASYKPRTGGENDPTKLAEVLQALNFKVVRVDEDQAKSKGIDWAIQKFKALCEKDESRSCIVAIMCHGSEHDSFLTYDFQKKYPGDIVNQFNNDNFPTLKGKPKCFLFQFCRGNKFDEGQVPPPSPISVADAGYLNIYEHLNVKSIPSLTDTLVCYSTIEDHLSYRCPEKGGWFIQMVTHVFKTKAHEFHLSEMMDIVAESIKLLTIRCEFEEGPSPVIKEVKQICLYYNIGFNKKFYLALPTSPHRSHSPS